MKCIILYDNMSLYIILCQVVTMSSCHVIMSLCQYVMSLCHMPNVIMIVVYISVVSIVSKICEWL